MSDSEIAQLCRKIYKQHYKALDLIYDHRPDLQLQISEFLQELVKGTHQSDTKPIIELDDSNKWWVRFALTDWDRLSFQKTCTRWTKTKRLVLFEFVINRSNSLNLNLVIGPGNPDHKKAIFGAVRHLSISNVVNSRLIPDQWSPIVSQRILKSSDYIEKDWEELQKAITSFWNKFIANDLTAIHQAVRNIEMPVSLTIHPGIESQGTID